jgi:hypothetical protein
MVKFAPVINILHFIRKVRYSNLGGDTDYSNRYISWFSQVPPGKFQDNSSKSDVTPFAEGKTAVA